jgi:hypothetical protein
MSGSAVPHAKLHPDYPWPHYEPRAGHGHNGNGNDHNPFDDGFFCADLAAHVRPLFERLTPSIKEMFAQPLKTSEAARDYHGWHYSAEPRAKHWAGQVLMTIGNKSREEARAILTKWLKRELIREENWTTPSKNTATRIVLNEDKIAEVLPGAWRSPCLFHRISVAVRLSLSAQAGATNLPSSPHSTVRRSRQCRAIPQRLHLALLSFELRREINTRGTL